MASKKSHKDGTAKTGDIASIALLHKGRVLLTCETRGGKTLLNLPGGKGKPGESLGVTAAREVHEKTGSQLSENTLGAIADLPNWVTCSANQGRAAVLHLRDDDPDGAVHTRFDGAAANAQRADSKTVEGLEWHPLDDVRSSMWRSKNMHFPGQHRAAAVMRVIGFAGTNPSTDGVGSPDGMGGLDPDVGSCATEPTEDTIARMRKTQEQVDALNHDLSDDVLNAAMDRYEQTA